MIERIFGKDGLVSRDSRGIEAGKINALYQAYGTEYDFCRFYRQGNCVMSSLDGSFVIFDGGNADIAELADFFRMNGFAEIFCSETLGKALAEMLSVPYASINVMRFDGASVCPISFDSSPALSDVYSVISEGFDIEFEPWYLDMSHRVRHGVSRCCLLEDKAALVIQHDINGEALISQVACRKAFRGQGIASRLVRAVSASLTPSEIYVICEDALIPFYEHCGFAFACKKTVITR